MDLKVVLVILTVLCTFAAGGILFDTFKQMEEKANELGEKVSSKVAEGASKVSEGASKAAKEASKVAKQAAEKAANATKKAVNAIKDMLPKEWILFKQTHKKNYSSPEEEQSHLSYFLDRINIIKRHNELFKSKLVSFKRAVNKFSDITLKEFIRRTNGFIKDLVAPNTAKTEGKSMLLRKMTPQSVDWRERGVDTPVKDQESCASCWSFAAAGAIEAHEKIKNGRKLDLSEQNLVDCAPSSYNMGCMGGHPLYAYNYTKENKGLSLRMYYPYENEQGQCRYKTVFNAGTYSIAYKRLPKGDEEAVKEAVAFIGPVAAAIDGTLDSLRDYGGGIYYDEECSSTRITHAVLIVGYGTEDGQDYWLIKNSLGPYWGEKGYMKLARNKNNHCGIATDVSYPLIESIPNHRF